MDQAQLNWLTNFIWNIADDVLRDVYVRGKYRDVILPMTVLRRLDAVLEPTKQAVLDMKAALDRELITNQDDALRSASGHPRRPTPTSPSSPPAPPGSETSRSIGKYGGPSISSAKSMTVQRKAKKPTWP